MASKSADIIVLFLAVWRLSKMVTEEEGPGMVFSDMREFAGAEFDGVPEQWDNMEWHGKLVQCPYCISVWLSAILLVVRLLNKDAYDFLTLSLAGSAATVLIEEIAYGQ